MSAAAATIANLVGRLTETQVRELLVDLLLGEEASVPAAKPARIRTAAKATAVRSAAKAKRVIDEEKRKRYARSRKAKRDAAKAEKAATPSAPEAKVEPAAAQKADGRKGSKYGRAERRNGKADASWMQAAKQAVTAIQPKAAD